MQDRQKIIVVLGPTASGKSELAVFLAKKFNGEIISADSRQVYKYLDIGTNKVSGKWKHHAKDKLHLFAIAKRCNLCVFLYKNIPHHCIDFLHPRNIFTVAEYKECAQKAINEITSHGNVPILAGGTGLYIQAVVDGLLLPEVPPNKKLRAMLEKKTTEQLFGMLQKLDPERVKHIDAKNPRRLIRAIEICKATGKQILPLQAQKEFQTLFIGIKKNDTELVKAIEKRSHAQVPELLKEIRLLLKLKISKKRIRELGFEYRLALEYLRAFVMPDLIRHPVRLQGNGSRIKFGMTKQELADMLSKENWRYAKRQMTWFKRNKQISWITTKKDALDLVRAFLKS